MITLELERRLHPWDRALLGLYLADQIARGNAGLPLGHTEIDHESFRLLAALRINLRDATWISTSAVEEVLRGAKESVQRITDLLSDGIERQEAYDAHQRALALFALALQKPPSELSVLRDSDESAYALTGHGSVIPELTDGLSRLSSARARAPMDWWLSVWNRSIHFTQSRNIPRFALYLDPGQASFDDMRELLAALSALHEAGGGSGFVFSVEGDRLIMSPVAQ